MGNATPTILHFVHDDKFIDAQWKIFNSIEGVTHRFVFPTALGRKRKLKYIKQASVEFPGPWELRRLMKDENTRAVIFHSLYGTVFPLLVLKIARADQKILWRGWGYDYYERLLSSYYPSGLLQPGTRALLERRPFRFRSLVGKLKRNGKKVFARAIGLNSECLGRVDYFSPVLVEEYEMAVAANPWFKAKHTEWPTGGGGLVAGRTLSPITGDRQKPVSILVGNSASPNNNHLEVFDVLKKIPDGRLGRVIVPLSYGGDEWYNAQILTRGHQLFGDKFAPLQDFMSSQQYMDMLATVDIAFFNHMRQQGAGNIGLIMRMGGKVYMNRASPLYKRYQALGGVVPPIPAAGEDFDVEKMLEPLPQVQREGNAGLMLNRTALETAPEYKKTRALIHLLLN